MCYVLRPWGVPIVIIVYSMREVWSPGCRVPQLCHELCHASVLCAVCRAVVRRSSVECRELPPPRLSSLLRAAASFFYDFAIAFRRDRDREISDLRIYIWIYHKKITTRH